MIKLIGHKIESFKKDINDTLKPYNKEQLDEELQAIKHSQSQNNKLTYDELICIAEIDVIQATEFNERSNYLGIFITIFAAFLVAINFMNSTALRTFCALLFFIASSFAVFHRANLTGKLSNAKQRVLLLKLAKEQTGEIQ